MTGIIEAFRYSFLGKGEFTIYSMSYATITTFIVLFFGILIYNRTEKNFVDTI
jgi:lipopolysaccharide transport system permease protein